MSLSADDKMAIMDLAARYNWAIDSGDAEAWAATFTPDGVFDSPLGTVQGTEALVKFAADFHERMPVSGHLNNSVLIDGDGESATLSCYLHLMRANELVARGIYRDTLAKVDGEWRFTHRQALMDDREAP